MLAGKCPNRKQTLLDLLDLPRFRFVVPPDAVQQPLRLRQLQESPIQCG